MQIFKSKQIQNQPEHKTFQEWTQIEKIKNERIYLKDGKCIILLKVYPVNFKLKSKLEQNAILSNYKMFLKNLNSKIQIIISSKKTDISYHLDEIYKKANENPQIKDMIEDYVMLLKQVISEKGAITKEFYIVIQDNPSIENDISKITEYLQNCGNEVEKCNETESLELLKNYTNKRLQNLV